MIAIHHICKLEGSLFITSELGGFEYSVFSRTKSCKSCKIQDFASGFRAQPGCEKLESQNFKKIKLLHPYFISATCLPREVE